MKQTNGNATRVQKVIMSDANKWLIKGKEEEEEVEGAAEENIMLDNDGDDETDHRGDIDETANSSTTTVIDNGQEVEVEMEGDKEEEEEKGGEERKKVEEQQSVIHEENSSNEDNNCGRASASSLTADGVGLPLATLQLRHSLELHQTAAVSEETTSAAMVAGNDVEDTPSNGLLGTAAAARTPPFTMAPSAKPRTPGILRLDTSGKKSRRSSGISSTVEFRNDPEMLGEVREREKEF